MIQLLARMSLLVLAMTSLLAVVPVASAQGSIKSETTQLGPFSKIQINGAGQGSIAIGPEPSITITANELVLDALDVDVSDDMLTVGLAATSALDIAGLDSIEYEITVPSLSEIHLNGTINLEVPELPEQVSLVIGLTTGAELRIDQLQTGSITGKVDLVSTAHLSGSAATLTIEVVNGSNLNAENLQLQTADIDLGTVSNATLRVVDHLSGSVSEGSNLSYIGENVTVDIETSLLGSIEQLPFTPWLDPSASPVAA